MLEQCEGPHHQRMSLQGRPSSSQKSQFCRLELSKIPVRFTELVGIPESINLNLMAPDTAAQSLKLIIQN